MHDNPLETGVKTIQSVHRTLSSSPGVYRMMDDNGKVLYVGKAKNLKNRVVSYTRPKDLPMRLKRMIAETRKMEIIETHTELEALLLEFNLIKELNPVYNILLKDDKAYPYILMTRDHEFPRMVKHRGSRTTKGDYYGPFANIGAVGRTLNTIQKIFQLRNCTDAYFAARKRPCLQYHIKRCTAPCVGMVTKDEYNEQVKNAQSFLNGKSKTLISHFADLMKTASDAMKFEAAAKYRDRIKALSTIQSTQNINLPASINADIFAIIEQGGLVCLSVFFIRNGQNFGNRTYFPKTDEGERLPHILGRFMIQFYVRNPVVPEIMVNLLPDDAILMEEALAKELGKKVKLTKPARGDRHNIVKMAQSNAISSLERHKAQQSTELASLKRVQDIFELEDIPKRIEVYDNSHTSGEFMLGGMIVATPDGFKKSSYRKFNIREADASDDYGMMREVMKRRFGRAITEGKTVGTEDWPDIILIDGGKGQLSAVTEVLQELGVYDDITVVSIAKGPDRNAGREDFYMNGRTPFRLPVNDVGLFYLQRLRDEAHRFAIGSMRVRRANAATKSPLDDIPGIGPKRKKALLAAFGSGKAISTTALIDLEKVDGISTAFAKKIYDYFHG
jgi:excinuclease ABC subunit C